MFSFVLQTLVLFSTLYKVEYVEGLDLYRHSARIIKGTDVNITDFPYYAGLLNCGAAILSESWVVTAAHCVTPGTTFLDFVWVGGETFRNSELGTFDDVVIHKQTMDTLPVDDIALLRLSEPLEFTDKIQPVKLPSFTDLTRSTADSKLVFTGRGIDENGYLTPSLQKMDAVKLSTEECLSEMPPEVQNQIRPIVGSLEKAILCAKRVDGGPGICNGDSGSPLMQGNTLVGIASFIGAPCLEASLGFYVNVVNYVPWIKSVTGIE